MDYAKKYHTLKVALQKQKNTLSVDNKLNQVIQKLDKEVIEERRTQKQAFFTLLITYAAFDVSKPERDPKKRLLETYLKSLDKNGKDLSDRSGETDLQDGDGKTPLISENEDIFIFLFANAKPLLTEKELKAVLQFFLSKEHEDEEAALKRVNWLFGVALYQKLRQSKQEAEIKRIQRVLLGYLSRKTNNEDIDHVLEKLKELNAYFSLDDIIFYRMVPDKVKQKPQAVQGPYQHTFLDEMRVLISGHYSNADIRVVRKYDNDFRTHSCRFVEMAKLLYKELPDPEKLRLSSFIAKLNTFDKKIRKYILRHGLQPNAGGGISTLKQSVSAKNKKLEAEINSEAEDLIVEAHELFDSCMPGSLSYHVMAIAFFALGVTLLAVGVLSLALLPVVGIATFGAIGFYGLCGSAIVTGFGLGLFSAPVLNKARQCVETSMVVADTALNVIEHCRDSGVVAAKKINLSMRPPKSTSKQAEHEKLEDPTSYSPR